jgi:hypothetical protein
MSVPLFLMGHHDTRAGQIPASATGAAMMGVFRRPG